MLAESAAGGIYLERLEADFHDAHPVYQPAARRLYPYFAGLGGVAAVVLIFAPALAVKVRHVGFYGIGRRIGGWGLPGHEVFGVRGAGLVRAGLGRGSGR